MNYVYIGMAGHVTCIDKSTGREVWRTKIKKGSSLTNLIKEGNQIIAYSGGHLFALNALTGDIQWENELKGLGYSYCIIAGSDQTSGASASAATAQQTATAASVVATTTAAT
ncbi:PQQ-binding-like beta-propeller repeat protein [Kangiella sp. HZ709]|uniref:outer membrane protein assembly factor BamB family protein n=1 Tax=Kangiella sp. HZ709 TaxID=2666328 RepID=UPI0012AF58AF|nr:PQQ-binding-like beta-propeller repeat protein [Kangiella sp. HZ709]MRX28420.1 PQQ-binding-like beta-propeller repeat protein [Kangiella sp. HZ709]